jgi:L-arabinose isomerase
MTATVGKRLEQLGASVKEAGFISDEREAASAADRLRRAGCDLAIFYVPTYLTATMVAPVAKQAGCPILFVDLQPEAAMDHPNTDTATWLSYCGSCALPEIGNMMGRFGLPFRSVSGYLGDDRAWARIGRWVRAAGVVGALRRGRYGLLGHLYPGMYDVATDITAIAAQLGGHVEVLEIDDLRVRVPEGGSAEAAEVVDLARQAFEVHPSVNEADLRWGARVAVGLRRLAADFALDTLAYYYRGLEGGENERLGAGMILGASLLTAGGTPACGEFELRTSIAMLVLQRLGAGGAFTELQALNYKDQVVEMGHDGPGHLGISARRPVLRGLGVYHGKRGFGVSVEFDVRHGPVTALGIGVGMDGRLGLVASEGQVVDGPLLGIGNTTSRVDFGANPGEWCDAWSRSSVGHHWALGVGHRVEELRCVADLLGLPMRVVTA